MCRYSLESYASRDAKEGETIVANMHYSGHGGTLSSNTPHGVLTCVKHETKLTVESMKFTSDVNFYKSGAAEHLPHDKTLNRYIVKANKELYRSKLEYKPHVVTLLDGGRVGTGIDLIEFENGLVVTLNCITPGTRFCVGVKSTLEEKLQLDEESLRVMRIDMGDPNPKPDDEEEKEKEDEDKKEDITTSTPRDRLRDRLHARINSLTR